MFDKGGPVGVSRISMKVLTGAEMNWPDLRSCLLRGESVGVITEASDKDAMKD